MTTDAMTGRPADSVDGDGLSFESSAPPDRRRPGPRSKRRLYRLLFALPGIVLVLFFFVAPFVANGVLSFTRWTGFRPGITFNGLNNFRSLAALGILGHAVVVTIVFAVTTMVVQNICGLAFAKALQQTNRVNSVFRALFFVPVLISPLAAGYIWSALLAPQGPVNAFISLFVPGDFTFAWLGNEHTALFMVGFIDGWKWSGLVTLVYIAGLNTIPRSVTEASVLDGAGAIRRFFAVEIPLLAPSFTFNIVLTLVGSFSALDVIFAATKGGPGDATSVLNFAVYQQYGQGLYGTSSALSFMIALMVIVVAVPLLLWLRKREVH